VPNTLAHLGVQALLTRSVIREADEKWIYVGTVLPDAGWILQRVLQHAAPGLDAYDLRLYSVAQTSLLVTLLLAAGVSLLTRRWRLTFAILALNAVLHLLLDAVETKWGNGVILLAPFDWVHRNWGWFWPEEWPAHLLTVLGLVYFLATLRRTARAQLGLYRPGGARMLLAVCLIATYITLPWVLRGAPLAANAHYVRVLRDLDKRAGAYVEFDRGEFHPGDPTGRLEFFAPPPVLVYGVDLPGSATVSVRGRFTAPDSVAVLEYHHHRGPGRDIPSLVGLFLILALLGSALLRDSRAIARR
jgi:hypothetical protein